MESADHSLKGAYDIAVKATIETTSTVIGLEDTSLTFVVELMCVVNAIVPGSVPQTTIVAAD